MILHAPQRDFLLVQADDLYPHDLDGVPAGEIVLSTRGWRDGSYTAWARTPEAPVTVSLRHASELVAPEMRAKRDGAWQRLGELDIPAGLVHLRLAPPSGAVLLTSDPAFRPSKDLRTKHDLAALFSDPSGASRIQPASATAGTWEELLVTYTAGEHGLAAGGTIAAGVIPFAWSKPQTDTPTGAGYVTVSARHPDGEPARIKVEPVEKWSDPDFDREVWVRVITLGRLEAGATISITYGDRSEGGPGIFVPSVPLRYDRNEKYAWYWHMPPLTVWVDARGNGAFVPLAHPHAFEVLSAPAAHLRVIAPSIVSPGERFIVHAVPVDRFRNVAGSAWQSEMALNAEGVFRIPMWRDGLAGESNPIRCTREPAERVYWGDFHVHCDFSDGVRSVEHLYDYGENVARLDVCGASDHSAFLTDTMWARNAELVRERHRPGHFVTLLGYEWGGARAGHRCVYTRGDALALSRGRGLDALWADLDAERNRGRAVIAVPHHTLASTQEYLPERADLEPLVELYSQWGNSEVRGNPKRPLGHWEPEAEDRGLSVQELLATGARLGFVGGSDNHDARPGMTGAGAYDIPGLRVRSIYRTLGHPGGLAAIRAPELTREAVFDALAARRCYATTGERILVEFSVNGVPMGGTLCLAHPNASREIRASVAGTAPVVRLTLVRDGQEVQVSTPAPTPGGDPRDAAYSWTDTAPLTAGPGGRVAASYYLRVEQEDGEMAWASPVWIESHDRASTAPLQ